MANRELDEEHHVARHCSKKDFVDDEMTELNGDVYLPDNDELGVSVNWMECYEGSQKKQVDAVCKDMAAERDVRKSHKLVVLQVGRAKSIGHDHLRDLVVVFVSRPDNESHSEIRNIQVEDYSLSQRLSLEASLKLVNAVSYERRRK